MIYLDVALAVTLTMKPGTIIDSSHRRSGASPRIIRAGAASIFPPDAIVTSGMQRLVDQPSPSVDAVFAGNEDAMPHLRAGNWRGFFPEPSPEAAASERWLDDLQSSRTIRRGERKRISRP